MVSVPVSTVQRGSIWKPISGLENGTTCAPGSKNDGFIRFWNRSLPFAGKAAFRRKAASGNRGPTLKQARCKLNLRDQRRTHCLSCFAVCCLLSKPVGHQAERRRGGRQLLRCNCCRSNACCQVLMSHPLHKPCSTKYCRAAATARKPAGVAGCSKTWR